MDECYGDNYGRKVRDKRKIKVIKSKENLMRISKEIAKEAESRRERI
jgi:hypothetical protein